MDNKCENSCLKLNNMKKGKCRRVPSICCICGDDAIYKYFGVISCQSCKIFFKRNAHLNTVCLINLLVFCFNFIQTSLFFLKEKFQCDLNGHCQINLLNRHICKYCRLKKCFDCGMLESMIRRSIKIKNKSN